VLNWRDVHQLLALLAFAAALVGIVSSIVHDRTYTGRHPGHRQDRQIMPLMGRQPPDLPITSRRRRLAGSRVSLVLQYDVTLRGYRRAITFYDLRVGSLGNSGADSSPRSCSRRSSAGRALPRPRVGYVSRSRSSS